MMKYGVADVHRQHSQWLVQVWTRAGLVLAAKDVYFSLMTHVYGVVHYTWSLERENELVLHRTEMRMIRWMRGVKSKGKLSCIELRQRLGIEEVKVIRLWWCGRILRNDDNN